MTLSLNARTRYRGRKEDLLRELRSVPAVIAGKAPDTHGLGRAFANTFAHALFGRIEKRFRTMSAGGADEFGSVWKPLSEKTIAYRPVSGAELRSLGITGRRQRGLLTPSQNKVWKGIFARTLALLEKQGVPTEKAKIQAAEKAWAILKSMGAQTKLSVLGHRKVLILIVSGRLLKSLSQGTLSGFRYHPPREQLFEMGQGSVTLGSKVPYAEKQHATRPLWPSPGKIAPWVAECGLEAMQHLVTKITEGK